VRGPAMNYAEFQSKAWNTRLITNWLDHETRSVELAPDDTESQLRTTLIWSLNESFHVSEAAGRWFTQEEANQYLAAVELTLHVYKELARRALDRGALLYPMRPKLHAWHEIALTAQIDLANPRFFHCFADEDYLKIVLRAARASPRAVMAAAVVKRYILKLALQWSGRGQRRLILRNRRLRRRPFRAPVPRL
jgi:hypothetical protein